MDIGILVAIVSISALLAKSGYQIWQNILVREYESLSISQSAMMSSVIVVLMSMIVLQPNIKFSSALVFPVLSGVGASLGIWSFTYSMQKSDLSVVSPIQQTIPVYAAIFEPIAFGTLKYQTEVIVACLLTVIGAYIVVMKPKKPFEPIRDLLERGGSLFALATAFLFGISAVFISLGTQDIDISYYLLIHSITGFLLLSILNRSKPNFNIDVLGYGSVYAINLLLSFYIISSISASRATIFFRISLIINVIVGFALFSEKHIVYRTVGSFVIILGVLISTL